MDKEQKNQYNRKWMKRWRDNNKEKANKIVRKWVKENPERFKIHQKKYQDKLKRQGIGTTDISLYGRYKKELLKLWNYQCVVCSSKEKLEVHHIDGNGSSHLGKRLSVKDKNNKLENLVIVCRKCHYWIHASERIKAITLKARGLWSSKGIPKCLSCGTTERKHWSRGLCYKCYELTRRKYKTEWQRKKSWKRKLEQKDGQLI